MNKPINKILKYRIIFTLLFIGLCIFPLTVFAKPSVSVKTSVVRTESTSSQEVLWLPYIFSTNDLGTIFGLGAMLSGAYQEQLVIGATAFTSSDAKTMGIAAGAWDYRLKFSNRLFITVIGMLGDYPLMRAYAPGDPGFVDNDKIRPGSNDSDYNDFIEASGSSNWWEFSLDYVLPIGQAKNNPIANYKLTGGLLQGTDNQPEPWNPLKNGTTILCLRQFNRYQIYDTEDEHTEGTIHAIELGLLYNNTDFPINPSQGNSQYIAISYDPAWLESSREWTFVEMEASQYFSLGETNYAKQRIVALNVWGAYSPSWEVETNDNNESRVVNNPPFLEGASLGGFYRMRGFRQDRFHDKAAIYATAEYRYTLRYNPIADINWLRFLKLDWFQAVAFVEGGRVSPTFNKDVLFDNWKTDIGLSLRALTAGIVLRFDIANSVEGTNMWVMVSHPF